MKQRASVLDLVFERFLTFFVTLQQDWKGKKRKSNNKKIRVTGTQIQFS